MAQRIKRLPAMQETQVRYLGWEDPLEKEMATHSSVLAWEIPWKRSLVGCSPWDRKESDMTERLTLSLFSHDSWKVRASLVAQTVKRLSAMQETQVRYLGWEDPMEKEMAAHSSILAWKIPWTEEPGRLPFMGSQRVGHD